jgi:hypothetical protein
MKKKGRKKTTSRSGSAKRKGTQRKHTRVNVDIPDREQPFDTAMNEEYGSKPKGGTRIPREEREEVEQET